MLQGSKAEGEWAGVECTAEGVVNGSEGNGTLPFAIDGGAGGLGSGGGDAKDVAKVVVGAGGGGSGYDILSRLKRMTSRKFPDERRREHLELAEYGPEEYVPLDKFPR